MYNINSSKNIDPNNEENPSSHKSKLKFHNLICITNIYILILWQLGFKLSKFIGCECIFLNFIDLVYWFLCLLNIVYNKEKSYYIYESWQVRFIKVKEDDAYPIVHRQGSCFPCNHTQAYVDHLLSNNPSGGPNFDVSHLWWSWFHVKNCQVLVLTCSIASQLHLNYPIGYPK